MARREPPQSDPVGNEVDEFRIRLARWAQLSRRVSHEAERARVQVAVEREKFLRLRREVDAIRHQKKVANYVAQQQCAMLSSSLALSSSVRKKRQGLSKMERIEAAYNACTPMFRAAGNNVGGMRKKRRPAIEQEDCTAFDKQLSDLVKKINSIGRPISDQSKNDNSSKRKVPKEDETDPGTSRESILNDESAIGALPLDADAVMEEEIPIDFGYDAEQLDADDDTRRDSFRTSWDIPGLTQDLNLIQDFAEESGCVLLGFFAGERQYFYLEPLSVQPLSPNECDELRRRWIMTDHDVQILSEFVSHHATLGKELAQHSQLLAATAGDSTADGPELAKCAFQTSMHSAWSDLQRRLAPLQTLSLVVHALGRHYQALSTLPDHAPLASESTSASSSSCDLLTSDTFQSDLFKYILRPIRSSAIESSLFDSLPISLVRESIEHCPELVNHVLQWKGEEDIPEDVRIDLRHLNESEESKSGFLEHSAAQFNEHFRSIDRIVPAIMRTIRGNNAALAIVGLVNVYKAVLARVMVVNTNLQLHKWASLFADSKFEWLDPDYDENADDTDDDRSYDKFTCLQDALYVWHKSKVLYSTKDLEYFNASENRASNNADNGVEMSNDSYPSEAEHALDALKRLTPASLAEDVRYAFVQSTEDSARFLLTPQRLKKARKQLDESLTTMRSVMSELGRAGPWRAHVKQSNELKRELARQTSIERKLVFDQWARFLQKYPDQKLAIDSTLPPPLENPESEQSAAALISDEATSTLESSDTNVSTDQATDSSVDTATTAIFDAKDPPNVTEMKTLRQEIEQAKALLLHNVGASGEPGGSTLSIDQQALVDECHALTVACVEALTKFLGDDESNEPTKTPTRGRPRNSPRNRVPSIIKATGAEGSKRADRKRKVPTVEQPSHQCKRKGLETEKKRPKDSLVGDDATVPSKRTKTRGRSASTGSHGEALRHLTGPAAPIVDFSSLFPARPASLSSSSSSTTLRWNGALRMGCSGCRDARRRCTGCAGCCIHCVCVSCGCRMCGSALTAAVQNTLTGMVLQLEKEQGCRWVSSSTTSCCGMLFSCHCCYRCTIHCGCSATGPSPEHDSTARHTNSTASAYSTVNGAPRRERRFPIRASGLRRRSASMAEPDTSVVEDEFVGGVNLSEFSAGVRPFARRPTGARGPLPTFDYSIEGAFAAAADAAAASMGTGDPSLDPNSFGGPHTRTWRPAPSDKHAQEDLFRAARVRMKLHRAFIKSGIGQAGGAAFLDGESLWQPVRIQMMWARRDFHGVLGVPRDATMQQIKRQYRKLALKLHPDKVADSSAAPETDARVDAFVVATHSYKILLGEPGATNVL